MKATLTQVEEQIKNPPPKFMSTEQACGYVLWVILNHPDRAYGMAMVEEIPQFFDGVDVSDTVLNSAIKWLEGNGLTTSQWKKHEGRGRPRRMFTIAPGKEEECDRLARLWYQKAIG